MHSDDPVDWHLWTQATRSLAKRQNKLLLLSSGYFACHWCHVMQAENYRNSQIAEWINRHFIAVKIDRELSPELDSDMLEFARINSGRAGWPQHLILTPQGHPFLAFGYLPPEKLKTLLQRTVDYWTEKPHAIEQLAQNALTRTISPPEAWRQSFFDQAFFTQLKNSMDDLSGGLKGSHKFPHSPILLALLQHPSLTEDIEEWLLLTLEQMQSQHLFDHVNGGFYRYCIDPEWQIPHFEKMAYDNALLAQVYLLAAQRWQREDFLETAERTLSFLQKHLYLPQIGLYLGSQSALDNTGNEGGNDLWSRQKLQQILPESLYLVVEQAWHLNQPPPYELGWHPKPTEQHWEAIRSRLQKHSLQAPIDQKALIGWNALILNGWQQAAILNQSAWWTTLSDPADKYPTIHHASTHAISLKKILLELGSQPSPPRAVALAPTSDKPLSIGQAGLQEYAYLYRALARSDHGIRQTLEQHIRTRFILQQGTQMTWLTNGNTERLGPDSLNAWSDDVLPNPTALLHCLAPSILNAATREILQSPLKFPSYLSLQSCPQPQKNIQ